jgi:hypothetical protein
MTHPKEQFHGGSEPDRTNSDPCLTPNWLGLSDSGLKMLMLITLLVLVALILTRGAGSATRTVILVPSMGSGTPAAQNIAAAVQ